MPLRFYPAVSRQHNSKIVLTLKSFGRTEGKGLLFLKSISYFFPGSSKVGLQNFLNVVRHSHFKIFQLVGAGKEGVSKRQFFQYWTKWEGLIKRVLSF